MYYKAQNTSKVWVKLVLNASSQAKCIVTTERRKPPNDHYNIMLYINKTVGKSLSKEISIYYFGLKIHGICFKQFSANSFKVLIVFHSKCLNGNLLYQTFYLISVYCLINSSGYQFNLTVIKLFSYHMVNNNACLNLL